MVDYQKMYAVLCGAIDSVLDGLQEIPFARPYAQILQNALLTTEEMYISAEEDMES